MGADELRGRGRPGEGFRGDWRSWPRGACSVFILWAFSWDNGAPEQSEQRVDMRRLPVCQCPLRALGLPQTAQGRGRACGQLLPVARPQVVPWTGGKP